MRVVGSCFLILLAGGAVPAIAFPLPVVDRHGDPLPAGSVGRLGTSQLRATCKDLQFSADGRSLVGITLNLVVNTWDAETGALVASRALGRYGDHRWWVRSADGRTVIVNLGTSLELIDAPEGKSVGRPLPHGRSLITRTGVSDDRRRVLYTDASGKRIPWAGGGLVLDRAVEQLILWETTTGTVRTLADDQSEEGTIAISPDGKRAVSSGGQRTRAWDITTGKKLWEVPNYNAEMCRFTLDGKYVIAAPGGGQREWHVWDAATGKPAAGIKPPTVGYACSFAVSPDGSQLLIPTDSDYVVWALKAGEVRHRWPGANQSGRGTFAPDGRSVVTYDTILRRWDLATGKNLYADVSPLGHTAPVRRVFLTPDGQRLISVGDDRTARVWEAPTTKSIRTIPLDREIDAWALTPDGSTLVGIDERLTVHRWPLKTDGPKTTVDLRDAQKLDISLRAREAHVLPVGTLAVLAWPRSPEYRLHRFSFSFWDLRTGKLFRWGGDPGNDYRGEYARMSPDGRLAATVEALHDTRTGARRPAPASPFGVAGAPLFSPDARLLVGTTARDTRVWEVATGRVIVDLPIPAMEHAAFSPDGRRLAYATSDRIAVWDVALRKPIGEWPAPTRITALAFGPDRRTVATGHADGTILLWPVPAPVPDGRWSESDANAAWDALADDLAPNAYPAVWQLTDDPAEAVRFLRAKVALTPEAGADEVGKLIADLDGVRFADREAATKKLRTLGRAAEGPLRQAIKRGPSPEQVARIESLLAGLEPAARPRPFWRRSGPTSPGGSWPSGPTGGRRHGWPMRRRGRPSG
jgi:WD40 repeat protein